MLRLAAVHGMPVNVKQPDLHGENTQFVMFTNPCGVNTATVADYTLPTWPCWMLSWEEVGMVRQCGSVGAGFPVEYQLHGKRDRLIVLKSRDQLFRSLLFSQQFEQFDEWLDSVIQIYF